VTVTKNVVFVGKNPLVRWLLGHPMDMVITKEKLDAVKRPLPNITN